MPKAKDHDSYIASAPDFARPILEKLRRAVHKACPDVEETIKWSMPNFGYEGMLAAMSAHKEHVRFVFWRGEELSDPAGLMSAGDSSCKNNAMGSMRFESAKDVPTQRVLVPYIKEAMRLNEEGKKPRKPAQRRAKESIKAPADLEAALKKNAKARMTYQGFSYTNRKDYVEWITEAKRDATRKKRIADAIAWMAEGKPRNWKYMKEWR